MKNLDKQTKAFTMIELIFVIVVLGILAALALPRLDRDLRQEAKDNILSAIRYTQHLALNDNKTDPFDSTWQSKLWNISFSNVDYNITSNGIPAVDPTNGKALDSTGNPEVNLGKKYSVNSISGCGNLIAFDHLGRPFTSLTSTNDYSDYMTSDCNITVNFSQSGITPLIFTIRKETGFVSGN